LFHNSRWKFSNKRIIQGYWIEITEEFQNLLDTRLSCGYCGYQVDQSENTQTYCPSCATSKWLTEKDKFLTELLPVSSTKKRNVSDFNLELYTQENGSKAKEAKTLRKAVTRQSLLDDHKKETEKMAIELAGKLLLLDNDVIKLENAIYYGHQDTWAFGWRETLSEDEKILISRKLSDINFPYNWKFTTPR
jgi:hypothetical protein